MSGAGGARGGGFLLRGMVEGDDLPRLLRPSSRGLGQVDHGCCLRLPLLGAVVPLVPLEVGDAVQEALPEPLVLGHGVPDLLLPNEHALDQDFILSVLLCGILIVLVVVGVGVLGPLRIIVAFV